MDQTIGNFSFGEIGLYLANGTLFALAALAQVQEKVAASSNTLGNILTYTARLAVTGISPVISYSAPSITMAQLPTVASIEQLPLATDATQSNAWSCRSGDELGNEILALSNSGSGTWSFSTHEFIAAQGSVGAGSTATTLISTSIPASGLPSLITGRYIVQFTSGTRKSYARYVLTTSPNSITFNTLGGVAPATGDTFVIYQSNVYNSTSYQSGTALFASDTGTANAYVASYSPSIGARANGMVLRFQAAHANTGASTFNDGLGAIPLLGQSNSALTGGEIVANGLVEVEYSSTLNSYVIKESLGGASQLGANSYLTASPATFDNSTKVATTGFVKATGVVGSNVLVFSTTAVPASTYFGGSLVFNGTSNANVTVPLGSTAVYVGARITIINIGQAGPSPVLTVLRSGSDTFNLNGTSYTSLTLRSGDWCTLEIWSFVGGNAVFGVIDGSILGAVSGTLNLKFAQLAGAASQVFNASSLTVATNGGLIAADTTFPLAIRSDSGVSAVNTANTTYVNLNCATATQNQHAVVLGQMNASVSSNSFQQSNTGTLTASVSFTAPAAGTLVAIGSKILSNSTVSAQTSTLYINGVSYGGDNSFLPTTHFNNTTIASGQVVSASYVIGNVTVASTCWVQLIWIPVV